MKRVLITGANSYVGTNVEKWLMKEPDKFYVETLDMKDPNWKQFDFSTFDVVFHVAGIAHVSAKKKMEDLYFTINRDLAIETAQKAKTSGIKQFIFMSSMIVYNSKETRITKETKPNPNNFYGESKLQAEQGIQKLQDKSFNVCILRPPMIYGLNSKGNFIKLVKLAKRNIFFPTIKNKRSMLYINNLAEFIREVIDATSKGTHFPKNQENLSTYYLYKQIRYQMGKKTVGIGIFNFIIKYLSKKVNVFNKLFGDYYYDFDDNIHPDISFDQSIKYVLKGILK